jgi:hypothetical protein
MFLSCFSPRSRFSKLTRSDLRIGALRQADRPGQPDPFEACGDIDTVAHEVAVALLNDIAEMDADPKFDALFGRESPSAALRTGFGESLDPDRLERLGRYEVYLDRKLERMLAMLLRLKDLRQARIAG